jgi:hypothetical protein
MGPGWAFKISDTNLANPEIRAVFRMLRIIKGYLSPNFVAWATLASAQAVITDKLNN